MPDGYSERGFASYKDGVATTYGHIVKVYESSAADQRHVWLSIEHDGTGPNGFPAGDESAHLTEAQAREVLDGLAEFLGLDFPASAGATTEGEQHGA